MELLKMLKYLIASKQDNKILYQIEAVNDAHSLIVATEFMMGLGLSVSEIKKNFKVYKQEEI
jgi:hypothetical protein